jgi:hypothetical protein
VEDNTSVFFAGHPDEFLYLNQGENPYIDGVDDSELFEETCEAFDLLGVHQDEQTKIFQVLAAILHLGNINIEEDDAGESTYINVSMVVMVVVVVLMVVIVVMMMVVMVMMMVIMVIMVVMVNQIMVVKMVFVSC